VIDKPNRKGLGRLTAWRLLVELESCSFLMIGSIVSAKDLTAAFEEDKANLHVEPILVKGLIEVDKT